MLAIGAPIEIVAVIDVMGDAYPELKSAQARVTGTLRQEEERFAETLEHGMDVLEAALAGNPAVLDGETAFRLYDTYGFPLDLTADIARERGVAVDTEGRRELIGNRHGRQRIYLTRDGRRIGASRLRGDRGYGEQRDAQCS